MEKPTKTPSVSSPKAKPVRRAGSLTLGICLTGYGILFLLHMITGLSYHFIFQVWPVLFILLGCEVLAGSLFHRGEQIRFDLFSCFMIFLAACFAMLLGFMDYGLQHNMMYFGL